MENLKSSLKKIIYPFLKLSWKVLPLEFRKSLSVQISKLHRFRGFTWLSMAIIRDLAERDVNAYHKFLWSNHIGYAKSYEKANDFGPENLVTTRKILFDDLLGCLTDGGIDPRYDINSVFEVGCSSGYLLRHMEVAMFPAASILNGVDIDCQAIKKGWRYLEEHGSKVHIQCANIEDLEVVLQERTYDLVLCAGVLMYVDRVSAEKIVATMLNHTSKMVVITGRACPTQDNSLMPDSVIHEDGTQIHNIDSMVEKGGGKVLFRRWEGSRLYDGYDVYFIICTGNKK